jgi:hypothetical protein
MIDEYEPESKSQKTEHEGKAPRIRNHGHARQKLTHSSQRYQFGGGDRRRRRQKNSSKNNHL